jgi:hypothetical protein
MAVIDVFTDGFTSFERFRIHHFDKFHLVRLRRLALVLFNYLFCFQIRQPRFAKVLRALPLPPSRIE